MKVSRKICFLVICGSFLVTSCRTGEILSEADPETEAEIQKSELPEDEL